MGEFFIERFDANMYHKRRKHKWDGDEKLTIEIKYFIKNHDTLSEEKSVVLDRDATVADLLNKVDGRYLFTNAEEEENKITENTKIDKLDQNEVYKVKKLK